jgi:hypothetical protein
MPDLKSSAAPATGSDMQRAVVAEQDARRAIADAEAAAAAELEAARAQARAILDAVPARIERLRQRGARDVERALVEIGSEEAIAMQALGETALPAELLEPTTAALVARLTGAPEASS